MKTLNIQLDDFAYEPVRAHSEDAGLDLRIPTDYLLEAGKSMTIDTGVHVEIEPGYYGKLESKSGLNINHGILCLGGVVDAGYSGSIRAKLYNLSDGDYQFRAGDKLVQLIIIPCATPAMRFVDNVVGGVRQDGGFGSSGR